MSYHFPMLTLDQAAYEGMRIFGVQPKSIHYKLCSACVGADNLESVLQKMPARSADEQIDIDDCAIYLRDQMAGKIPHAADQYTDRPERAVYNPFAPVL